MSGPDLSGSSPPTSGQTSVERPPPPPGRPEPYVRGSGRLLGALVAIVLILLVAGIADAVTGSGTPPPISPVVGAPPTSAATTRCPPATTPLDAVAAHLATVFVPAPAGFVQAPDTEPPNGPMSLEAYTQGAQNPPLAQSRLQSDGFLGGYRRVWDDASAGVELHIVLFQFTCADGAYEDLQTDGSDPGLPSQTDVPIPGIPNVDASAGGPDKDGNYEVYAFASKGAYEMAIYLFGAKPPDPDSMAAIAQAQFRLLPSSS